MWTHPSLDPWFARLDGTRWDVSRWANPHRRPKRRQTGSGAEHAGKQRRKGILQLHPIVERSAVWNSGK